MTSDQVMAGSYNYGRVDVSISILFKYYFVSQIRSLTVKTREIPRLLIFSLALVPLGVMAQTPGASPRTIRVVMDNAYAPYSFQSDQGKLQGILIDQWQAWEKKTGIKAEIHALDWDEALQRLRAGEFDVIDCIVETAGRRDYFDFTPAYATIEASIFFRKDISGISDLASLKGFPVGVKAGDQHIDQLKANGVTTVIVFQNNDAIIEAAKQHKINVFLIDDPSALYLLNKMGIEEEFRHSSPVFRDQLRRAVRKGDAATLRIVSDGFAAIDPGELKQIDEKWFGRTINRYGRYLTYAAYAAAVAILLIAGLVAWNRTLRKKILRRTAALGESEERFRQIAENIREVFWMSTGDFGAPHFTMLYISPAYESVWGRTCESLYQDPHSFIEAIHPEDRARVVHVNEQDQEQGFEIEYRVVRPDGSMRWIRDRGFPIKDSAGRFYRLTGIAEDITERKEAEDALRRSEDRIRLIIDTIPTMAWSLRPDGVLDFLNQRWLDYTGLSLREAIAEPTRTVHPEDLSRAMEKWLAVKATSEAYEDEMRLQRADGEYRWFLVRIAPLLDEQGNLLKRYGVAIDIEERRRADAALKESQRKLEEAQRIAHVGHWDRDLETGRITWSDEMYRILGLPLEERDAPRTEWLDIAHPEDRQRLSLAIEEMQRGIRRFDVEFRIVRPNGEVRFLHSQGDVIRDERGRPLRRFGTAQDITESKQAEEQLRATTEQLRALSASLQAAREEEATRIAREIHDELGSALTSLKWELEAADETISESGDQSQLQELRKKIESMMTLTDTTIYTVRRISSELRPIALDDLGLTEAIEWQARQFQERTGIVVESDCALENPGVSREHATAAFRIFQEALTNILRHAQATTVYIQSKEEDGELILTISDNGRGIKEDEKSGQRTLGLLGMRERAHLIGGKVEITGSDGKGTVVIVRIPISG